MSAMTFAAVNNKKNVGFVKVTPENAPRFSLWKSFFGIFGGLDPISKQANHISGAQSFPFRTSLHRKSNEISTFLFWDSVPKSSRPSRSTTLDSTKPQESKIVDIVVYYNYYV